MNDKCRLTRQIHALDFSIKEMELYLDVHPYNRKALNLISGLRRKRAALVEAYEQHFGRYIVTSHDAKNEEKWEWIDSPWPWEVKEGEF